MTEPMLTPNILKKMRDEFLLWILTEFRNMSNRTPYDLTSVSPSFITNCKVLYSFYFVVLESECDVTDFFFFPCYSNSSLPISSVAFPAFCTLQCKTRVFLSAVPSLGSVYPLPLLGVVWFLVLHSLPLLRGDLLLEKSVIYYCHTVVFWLHVTAHILT